ncbi:MAG: phospholipase D-like domain-containing protein [Clostridiales bacterium]|jgi:phosphatidylserine/phosphatidylglycerophosphate/cardiolipin synthase-like enzyme|nr:phospholipase D-like domain-containing protein [Clostridiales bacterium]
MTTIINNPYYSEFLTLSANARRSVRLCAPFVKVDVITDILNVVQDNVKVDLITKVDLKSYHSNVSDIAALQSTLSRGGNVYNCSNLHAKVYLFDDTNCIITSANLTTSGFQKNVECGVVTGESSLVGSAVNFFNQMVSTDDVGEITESNIAEIERILSALVPMQKMNYPQLNFQKDSEDDAARIAGSLTGWKRDVFIEICALNDDVFTSVEVEKMAESLCKKYPRNNYREAKIRQILQQLRDLGLIEFGMPGVYKKLWN